MTMATLPSGLPLILLGISMGGCIATHVRPCFCHSSKSMKRGLLRHSLNISRAQVAMQHPDLFAGVILKSARVPIRVSIRPCAVLPHFACSACLAHRLLFSQ